MRAVKLLLALEIVLFSTLFFDVFTNLGDRVDLGGRSVLGAFECLGVATSLYLLSKSRLANASLADWLISLSAILVACFGFISLSISLFAGFLFIRGRNDIHVKAAGTVAIAVAVQAFWAPLIFSKLSYVLLQIDAGIVGELMRQFVPGATWNGTVVYTPSGHNVAITAQCASFHNLSLATLCWVTLTMIHRPYWMKGDLYIGLGAALIQFAFNVWRLVFVCLSLPMYEFWHEGLGKHIFSAVATACAILFVQAALLRQDRRNLRGVVAPT
jgi:hypothetical protein